MNLNKYKHSPNDDNVKKSFNNIHPFSSFKVSKVRNGFLKQINNYKEKEKKCMTLFGVDPDNIKNTKGNQNNMKKYQKSLSSSSIITSLKELFSLNHKKKNSLPVINQINLNFQILPHIKRSIRKYRTNLLINTNNINNIKFDNPLLNNIINEKKVTSKNLNHKSTKSPFITEMKEINQINSPSKQNNSEFNPNLKLTEILNENNQKTISNNKLMSFNNHFSFNNLIPFNQLKSFRFDSHSLSNDKLFLKSFSNKSLVGIKPLSLIKTPRNNRYKFSQNYSLSENKLNLNHINMSKDKNKQSSISSLKSQDSENSSAEIISTSHYINEKIKIEDKKERKYTNKKKKMIFNLKFKNKIFSFQQELDRISKEHEENEDEYNLYIKYMIKKCKFICGIIDKNFTNKIPESEYNIKRKEMSKFMYSVLEEKNNKKKKAELEQMRFQITRNLERINSLIVKNNYLNRRVYSNAKKFIDKSNNTD